METKYEEHGVAGLRWSTVFYIHIGVVVATIVVMTIFGLFTEVGIAILIAIIIVPAILMLIWKYLENAKKTLKHRQDQKEHSHVVIESDEE